MTILCRYWSLEFWSPAPNNSYSNISRLKRPASELENKNNCKNSVLKQQKINCFNYSKLYYDLRIQLTLANVGIIFKIDWRTFWELKLVKSLISPYN